MSTNNNYIPIENTSISADNTHFIETIDGSCSNDTIVICGGNDNEDIKHNDLEGLQGGSTYERYHLTRAQYLDVVGNHVNLIAGTHITITGTYPNLTINGEKGFSGSYLDLTNKPTLFDGNYNSLTNRPTLFDGTWNSLLGKPTFATVATTGNYVDLLNKPTLFSGSYNDLTDKPNGSTYIQNVNSTPSIVQTAASINIDGVIKSPTAVFGNLTVPFPGANLYSYNSFTNPAPGLASIGSTMLSEFTSAPNAGYTSTSISASAGVGANNNQNWPITTYSHPVISAFRGVVNSRPGATGTIPKGSGLYLTAAGAGAVGSGPSGALFDEFNMIDLTYDHTLRVNNASGLRITDLDLGINGNTFLFMNNGDSVHLPNGNWGIYSDTNYNHYLGTGNTLIGSTTDNGATLQVTGDTSIEGYFTVNGIDPENGALLQNDVRFTNINGNTSALITSTNISGSSYGIVQLQKYTAIGNTVAIANLRVNSSQLDGVDILLQLPSLSGTLARLEDIPSGITIDAVPTDSSNNAVSSNGVFDALVSKANDNQVVHIDNAENINGEKNFLGGLQSSGFLQVNNFIDNGDATYYRQGSILKFVGGTSYILNIPSQASTLATTDDVGLKQNKVTLTTTGSGAASFNQASGLLNIPTSASITIDSTPTSASTNAVSSGGVFTALATKASLTANIYSGSQTVNSAGGSFIVAEGSIPISGIGKVAYSPSPSRNLGKLTLNTALTDGSAIYSNILLANPSSTGVSNYLPLTGGTLANDVDLALKANVTDLDFKQALVTLTTSGSGVATFNQSTGALNIPTPSTAYAPTTGGTGYIQNQNAGVQATSSFNISGGGTFGGTVKTNFLDNSTGSLTTNGIALSAFGIATPTSGITISGGASNLTWASPTASFGFILAANSTTNFATWRPLDGTVAYLSDLTTYQPLITATDSTQYYRGDKTFQTLNTSVVPEGTNLYATNARALSYLLNGYVTDTNTAIAASDNFLGAFQKIQGQINARAPLASPVFTGTPNMPTGTVAVTQSQGNSSAALATTMFVTTGLNLKSTIASPTFTGTPAAPTASAGTNTTQLATTAYVMATSGIVKTLTASGNGSTTSIVIAHGVTGVSSTSARLIEANNSASAGIQYTTIDATNITIVYTVAPVTGSSNLSYSVLIKP